MGCIVWHCRRKQYLVYWEHKRGSWEFPKGGQHRQDRNEWETGRRETFEETGVWIHSGDWERVERRGGIWYCCQVTDDDITEDHRDRRAHWWTEGECMDRLRDDHRRFLCDYEWPLLMIEWEL